MPVIADLAFACRLPVESYVPLDKEVRAIYEIFERTSSSPTHSLPLLEEPFRDLKALENLSNDWDGTGADAPNYTARMLAERVLRAVASLTPYRPAAILPSVEGGIGISLVEKGRRGIIEVLNSGEIAAAVYEGRNRPEVWELEPTSAAISDTVERIRAYLSA